jgi:hypothetical protein
MAIVRYTLTAMTPVTGSRITPPSTTESPFSSALGDVR